MNKCLNRVEYQVLASIFGAAGVIFLFFTFDSRILLCIRQFHQAYPKVYQFLENLDRLMSLTYKGLIAMTVLLAIYGFLKKKEIGKVLTIAMIVVSLIVHTLKHTLGRARPILGFETSFVGPSMSSVHTSFPSGHTAFAFALATVISYYYPRYRYLFYVLAIWIGFERIEDFAHFPSDVLMGAFLGIFICKLILSRIALEPRSSV
jgi:undecaprenyl-diphosphatase